MNTSFEFNGQRLTAVEGSCCAGCLFSAERFVVCVKACAAAMDAGLPDCDQRSPRGKTYIYVLDQSDLRQLPLPTGDGS